MRSVLTQSALDSLCEKYYIPDVVHPELLGPNSRIRNSPTGKIGVYRRFFDFANYRIPLSRFLVDILEYFRINLSQLSIIAAAKAIVANKPKVQKRRRKAGDASGSNHPPKKLMTDHGTFGDVGASTGGKSLAAIQELFKQSTLNVEVGVSAAATIPFMTSSVTPTPKREDGSRIDYVTGTNLRTQLVGVRFVVLFYSSHHSGTHAAGDEVIFVVRSSVPDPAVLTTTIATTVVAGTSVPLPREVNEPARASIFADSTSVGIAAPDVAGPSQPAGDDISSESFYTCLSAEVRMRLEHVLRRKKRLEGKCDMHAKLLKERDTEIADLKARLSLKEAEAAKAIRLRGQITNVEAAEAARAGELNSLRERNAVLESTVVAKDSKIATLSQDLSSLQLSCDDLSIKASTLECEKDKLADQVSVLEATCSELRDEVSDVELVRLAFHLDEEFYPRFLTTIAGRRWILSHGLKLVVMKCLRSLDYLAALEKAICCAIDKGMHYGMVTGIDHEKAGRSLADVVAYDSSVEGKYISAVSALRVVDFLILAQLASQKDVSITGITDLLLLEGSAAKAPEAKQLQPSHEQLMLPIHRSEDDVHLSISEAIIPLVESLSGENLLGGASTSGVLVSATNIALSTTFVQDSSIPPISVVDHGARPSVEAPPSKIVFEQEELDTPPEHTSAL
ncbi:hypothetical protein Tco_1395132 [Tanacetum coccineum]